MILQLFELISAPPVGLAKNSNGKDF